MKVQLIQPTSNYDFHIDIKKINPWNPPLGLLSVGSFILDNNQNIELEILDGSLMSHKSITERINADMIGISTTICNYKNALEVAEIGKNKGATIVFGGPHASVLSGEILTKRKDVDFIIRGDGERAFLSLVKGKNNNSIYNLVYRFENQIIQNPTIEEDINDFPKINFNLIDMEPYFANFRECYLDKPFNKPFPYYSQKGCLWREISGGCIFCGIPYNKHRKKRPGKVWKELTDLVDNYGADYVYEVSDSFTDDGVWLENLVKEKPPIQIALEIFSRATSINERSAASLKEIGVYEVYIGMESGDDSILKTIKKGETVKDYLKAVKLLEQNNIYSVASFILGHAGENRRTLENTLTFIDQLKEFDNIKIWMFPMLPLPRSPSFRKLLSIPEMSEKYSDKDLLDPQELSRDWVRCFCNIDYNSLEKIISKIKNEYS